jgi:phage tail-like protein
LVSFFRIELDGVKGSASFRKCGGVKSETEVFEYQQGGDNETVRKLVGPSKVSNLVLTKGYATDKDFFSLREELAAHNKPINRRNGSIVVLAPDGKTELRRWNFTKALLVRWETSDWDASSGEIACEVLELAVEKITEG